MKTVYTVTLLLLGVVALQLTRYLPQLPDEVAGHFQGSGHADGWQSKGAFLAVYAGVLALMLASFYLLPLTFKSMNTRWFNLPHKDYWLDPSRREQTVKDLRLRMGWMGIVTIVFLIYVFQCVIQANLQTPPRLSNTAFLSGLGLFLAFTLGWSIRFALSYRGVAEEDADAL